MFKALLIDKQQNGEISSTVTTLNDTELPAGEVMVDVEFSGLNYKDGLCLTGGGNLVRTYPHVAGIDFAGTVSKSNDQRYQIGDKVILTGWRVGELYWGGYAEKASVKADWLVPLPKEMTTKQAMILGTAGFTAMLAIDTLEKQGLSPNKGAVLVTGASGGVGSVAVLLLAELGYQVSAVTGKSDSGKWLTKLGATEILSRQTVMENNKSVLGAEHWAGVVDSVAGEMLGQLQKQVKYGGSIAAIGLAGGVAVPSFTVIPYLLRGINLLGIDSVMCPADLRIEVWQRLGKEFPFAKYAEMTHTTTLYELPSLANAILQGKLSGRWVVDVSA